MSDANAFVKNLKWLENHFSKNSFFFEKLLKSFSWATSGDNQNVFEKMLLPKKISFSKKNHLFIIHHVGMSSELWSLLEKEPCLKIFFIENDFSHLKNFLLKSEASRWLKHPRVKFFSEEEEMIEKLGHELVFLSPIWLRWENAPKEDFLEWMKLQGKCIESKRKAEAVFSWYSDFGEKTFQNFFTNLCSLKREFFSIEKMGKKGSVLPAIICGAGHSLKSAYPKLKTLQDKALILAGGSAMNFLNSQQIFFQFGATVEKIALPKHFSEFFPNQKFFTLPIASSENLSQLWGDLFFAKEQFSYPWTKILEEKIFSHNDKTIDQGFCVTSFLVSIAQFLGCSPIILVGVDLSYKNNEKYPEKSFNQKNSRETVALEKISEKVGFSKKSFLTQKDWLVTRSWLEEFALAHPEIEWINSSEGLTLKNFSSLPFSQIDEKLTCSLDIEGWTHYLSHQAQKTIFKKDLTQFFKEVKDEILKAQEAIDRVFTQEINIDTADFLFSKMPIAFLLLNPLWIVFRPILAREIEKMEEKAWTQESEKIHRFLFYKRVLEKYMNIFKEHLDVCLHDRK